MTESGFNRIDSDGFHGNLIPLEKRGCRRYNRYKVRLYGVLHFVKRPAEDYREDLVTFESLRKEFTIGYSLNHPAVVRYLLFENGELYEEFIEGKTLREMIDEEDPRLHDKNFPAEVCRQLLDASDYIHSRGILHLDIKPENVMITDIGNRVKLIDFGCARSADCDSTPGHTPEYMAPEQAEGTSDVSTDIYLIGKLMEELAEACGQKKRWKKFIDRAVSDQPSLRFKTDREAAEAIPRSARRKVFNSTIVIAVLTAVVIVLWLVMELRNSNTAPQTVSRITDTVFVGQASDTSSLFPSETDEKVFEETQSPDAETTPLPVRSIETEKELPDNEAGDLKLRQKLEKDIEKHIADTYKRIVAPVCEDHSLDGADPSGASTHTQAIRTAMSKALEEGIAYGKKLSALHPEQEAFISGYLMNVMNGIQQVYMEKMCYSTESRNAGT